MTNQCSNFPDCLIIFFTVGSFEWDKIYLAFKYLLYFFLIYKFPFPLYFSCNFLRNWVLCPTDLSLSVDFTQCILMVSFKIFLSSMFPINWQQDLKGFFVLFCFFTKIIHRWYYVLVSHQRAHNAYLSSYNVKTDGGFGCCQPIPSINYKVLYQLFP